jgi:hypothetical protein
MAYEFHRRLDGFDFFAPSTIKNKKYDVYYENPTTGNINKISFGDNRYEQYKDRIGYYSDLNHLDKNRRENYRARHKNDLLNNYSAGYFSWNYLW